MKLTPNLMDELDGEGSDLGGGSEPGEAFEGEAPSEPQPWEAPIGELRETLQAAEGRFGDRLSPLHQQLQSIQQALGQQTTVEVPDDKLAALEALFTGYDPKFEGVGDLLRELLTSSVRQHPLTAEGLQPLVEPLLQQQRYEAATERLTDIMDRVSFVHEDLFQDGWVESPKTDTQKLFLKWWDRADQATRSAVTSKTQDGRVADPYAYGNAMRVFDKFYRSQTQSASESAGASAARLAGATQTRSSGRSNPAGGQLRTEADGFASVFKQAS
jgi:hypothetical protein